MTTIIDGRYYRVQISAENNTNFRFNEGKDIDEIFQLTIARFIQSRGAGFSLYEATLMKTKLSLSSKKKYEAQEEERINDMF